MTPDEVFGSHSSELTNNFDRHGALPSKNNCSQFVPGLQRRLLGPTLIALTMSKAINIEELASQLVVVRPPNLRDCGHAFL
jgi:hypothetical protein